MPYCGNCGAKLEEGALFCGNCGTLVPTPKENEPTPAADPNNLNQFSQQPTSPSPQPQPRPQPQPQAQRPAAAPRQQAPAAAPKQRIVVSPFAIVMLVVIVGAALIFTTIAKSGSSTSSTTTTPTEETTEQATPQTEADQPAQEAPAQDEPAQDSSSQDTPAQDSSAQETVAPESTQPADEHEQLRAEAEAAGEQVFEGYVLTANGMGVARMLGTTDMMGAGDNSFEIETQSFYALLDLGSSQPVYVTGYSLGPVTQDFQYLQLAVDRYNPYSGTTEDGGYSQWEPYAGQHVCIAAKDFWIPEGVSVMNQTATSSARLLYVMD